jgi:hypothetical protein
MRVRACWICRADKPLRYWVRDGMRHRSVCSLICKRIARANLETDTVRRAAGYYIPAYTSPEVRFECCKRP